jgi:hypothetical protein
MLGLAGLPSILATATARERPSPALSLGTRVDGRQQFMHQLQPLRRHLDVQTGHTCHVAARSVEAGGPAVAGLKKKCSDY